MFFALPEQRRKGSLYGDLRLFDDKHGVSQNGYHLACCTVQGNQSLDCVACALIDTSNGTNWSLFVEDCVKAFETTTNAPKRKWNIAIADGDGCIYSAVKAEDPQVQLWSCWEHFDRNIRSKYCRWTSQWKAILKWKCFDFPLRGTSNKSDSGFHFIMYLKKIALRASISKYTQTNDDVHLFLPLFPEKANISAKVFTQRKITFSPLVSRSMHTNLSSSSSLGPSSSTST